MKVSEFEFVIPINKEDLFHIGPAGQYVVDQTYSKNELPGKLRGKVFCSELKTVIQYYQVKKCDF